MNKLLQRCGVLLLLSACTKTDRLTFVCTPRDYTSFYKSTDGLIESYRYISKKSKYEIKSNKPQDPDHDIEDGTDIDVLRSRQSINIGYFILISENMDRNPNWNDKYLTCHKIFGSGYSITARCKSAGDDGLEYEFTYTKARGVTSIRQICPRCNESGNAILTSKYGIGKSCD